MLTIEKITELMSQNAERVAALVQGVSAKQARWRPGAGAWSILEVVNHLADEEREDFRVRLDYILHKPDQAWPSFDQQAWAEQRRYNERDLQASLEDFLSERRASLEWLRSVGAPDWDAMMDSRAHGLRAGDVAASWIVHDILHLRQILRLERQYTERLIEPYSSAYASG